MTGIPLNIDWQQILLHLFNFAILAGGLYLLLYKPVKDFIKKREDYYKQMDESYNATKAEADTLKKEYEDRLSGVQVEIDKKRNEAEEEIKELRAQKIAQAQKEADEILKKGREDAKREHDKMLSSVTDEVKELATTAAKRVLLESQGDPFDAFLALAERGEEDGRSS